MAKLKRHPINALDDLAADKLRRARDLLPAVEWAQRMLERYDVDSLAPVLKAMRERADMIRRATQSLTVSAPDVEVITRLSAASDAAGTLNDSLGAKSTAAEIAKSFAARTEALTKMRAFDMSPAVTEAIKALSTNSHALAALRTTVQVDTSAIALTQALQPQIDFAASIRPVLAASGVLDEINKLSGLSAQWRSALENLDQIRSVLPTNAFDNINRITESFRAAVPTAFSLDPSLFGGAWNEELTEAVERLRLRAERLAADPDADVDDMAAVVADVEAIDAAAPPAVRASLNPYLIVLAWWLLDKALEDPAKQLIRDACAALLIVLSGLAPSTPPPVPMPPPLLVAPAPDEPGARLTPDELMGLPAMIRRAGPEAEARTLDFLANVRNRNTRDAYVQALVRFTNWCEERELQLSDITDITVNAYIAEIARDYKASTVRQHLAAIRLLFDHLVSGGVVPVNPASDVRGPKETRNRRRTALQPRDVRRLLDSIDAGELSAKRDRALIALMVYAFAQVSPLVAMDVKDYSPHDGGRWFSLRKNGGRRHEVPAHPQAQAYVDAYLDAARIANALDAPLWRTMAKDGRVSERRMSRMDVYRAVKRRADDAMLGAVVTCQNLRAAGLTAYLANGGTVKRAQIIAAHASPRTTRQYEPSEGNQITAADIERIGI